MEGSSLQARLPSRGLGDSNGDRLWIRGMRKWRNARVRWLSKLELESVVFWAAPGGKPRVGFSAAVGGGSVETSHTGSYRMGAGGRILVAVTGLWGARFGIWLGR